MRIHLLLLFLFTSLLIAAQPDSIIQGVIHVKRPLEPAKYSVSIKCYYSDFSGRRSHINKVSRNEIVMTDSAPGILSAQPFAKDSVTPARGMTKEVMLSMYPDWAFNWSAYLADMRYGFQWNDSTKLDSAQFAFRVNADGTVEMKSMPWRNADSASKVLQKEVDRKMAGCAEWFPARFIKGDRRRKTKLVSSTVVITVYANDYMEGRIKPLEVVR